MATIGNEKHCMNAKSNLVSWNNGGSGFTLVELLVAMMIGMVATGAVYSVYTTIQRTHRNQQLSMGTQQNLRGAIIILEQEIRMIGYDPMESGKFGIVDIRRYSVSNSRDVDIDGQPALFFTLDLDENGALDDRNGNRNREHPNFRIRNDENIGRLYLAWDMGSGRQPLAENIQAMGLAYAIDVDQDGTLDCWKDGSNTIWAVDADNDNRLDTHLDNNDDGRIDSNDDINADGKIDGADGGTLDSPVGVEHIKAVRVWLLAVSSQRLQGHQDSANFIVGDRLMPATRDGYLRKVLETIIFCRNL
jgi:type IV pilus assembly protein PilW